MPVPICTEEKNPKLRAFLLRLIHYYSTPRVVAYSLLVNEDGQNPSQMHDSLGGPPYLIKSMPKACEMWVQS